jgi:hypothetical protein
MGIFSRSKKHPQTRPKQSTALESPPPAGYHVYHTSPQAERPITSHSHANGLMPPQGWPANPPPYPASPYQPYQQIFVSNYILPAPQSQSCGNRVKNKLQSASMIHLPQLGPNVPSCIPGAQIFNDGIPFWHQQGTQYLNQSAALYDLIRSKFNSVVTSIDSEKFSGNEKELWVQPPPPQQFQQALVMAKKDAVKEKSKNNSKDDIGCPIAAKITSSNYFTKVNMYANSRLPMDLPVVKLYVPCNTLI